MYTEKKLRAKSYDEFFAACESAGLVHDGKIVTSSKNYAMDLIGTVYNETGKMIKSDNGTEYPETEPVDGYHVNLRYKEDIGLSKFEIEVKTPYREFA